MKTTMSHSISLNLGLLVLAALVLAVGALPNEAWAVDCGSATLAGDADQDGIPDRVECNPGEFTFLSGLPALTPCQGDPPPTGDTRSCLDPDSKDAFVVLVKPASGSILAEIVNLSNTSPFEFLFQPRVCTGDLDRRGNCTTGKTDGLGLRVHVVEVINTPLDASARLVIPDCQECHEQGIQILQGAIQITENLQASPISGRMSTYGTPTHCPDVGCIQDADGIVFTQRIKDQVNGVYNDGRDHPDDWVPYIKRTLAHEIVHALALTVKYVSKNGGNHHSADDKDAVMQQYVTYSTSGGIVFHIGKDFATADENCHLSVQVDSKGNSTCQPF